MVKSRNSNTSLPVTRICAVSHYTTMKVMFICLFSLSIFLPIVMLLTMCPCCCISLQLVPLAIISLIFIHSSIQQALTLWRGTRDTNKTIALIIVPTHIGPLWENKIIYTKGLVYYMAHHEYLVILPLKDLPITFTEGQI